MSDDLVERLRDTNGGWASDEALSAADRIEQLATTCEGLEAKLAKAVNVLRFYAEGEWAEDYPGGVLYAAGDDTSEFKTHLDYGDLARTTLAELSSVSCANLKGETDE